MRYRLVLAAALLLAFAGQRALADEPRERRTSWLQRKLESGLSEGLGGTVRIGRMDVDWTSLSVRVGDVAISIPAEGAPPLTAAIGEGRLRLAWSGLSGLGGGQVHITEVVAKGATFSFSREWVDAVRPDRKDSRKPVAVQIDHLVVEDATASYLDRRQGVKVTTSALNFQGDWSSSRRLLIGEVHAAATIEAPIFKKPWPATVRGGLRLGGKRLEIFGATGAGPGASAELAGNVTWGVGTSFTADGRLDADFAVLSPYIVGDLRLAGRVEGPVQIVDGGGVPIRITMRAATTGFHVGPIATDTARGLLTLRPGRLDFSGLEARGYGGAFSGSVGLTFGGATELQTDLTGTGADLQRLIRLAGADLPIAADADVTFRITGDPGKPATWQGGGTFDAARAPKAVEGRIPARGRGRLSFASGLIRVDAESLELADARLALRLESSIASAPRQTRVTIDGTTRQARVTQLATQRFLDAFGVARNRFILEPIEGRGHVRAEVTTGKGSSLDLQLALQDGSWAGESFDTASVDLGVDERAIVLRRVELVGNRQSLAGHATFDARTGAVDQFELSAQGADIAPLLSRAGVSTSFAGVCDVDLRGFRDAGVLAAEGRVTLRRVTFGHEIIDSIEGPVRIEGDQIILDGLTARGHGLEARGSLTYDLTKGEAVVDLASAQVDLQWNRSLADVGLGAQGTIRAQGLLTITREGPSGRLSLMADDLVVDTGRGGLREVRLGDLQGNAIISPRGLELTSRSLPDGEWTFDAYLGFAPKLPLSAVLYFENLVVGAGGTFGESVDLKLKGQVQAEGELTEPAAMEINGSFDEVDVRVGPTQFRATEPFPVRLDGGRFVLGPSRFVGGTGSVEISGSGSVADGVLAGYLRGTVDLGIASSFWSELRGSGPVEIDATLGGTIDRPDLKGRVAVHDGRLRLIGYRQSLESIDAEALFEGQSLTLASFHAFEGGGEVSATGRVQFDGIVPSSYQAVFTAANVSAEFPEGFRGTYQGRIAVEGTAKKAMISGRIEIARGLYSKDFDVGVGLVGGTHREFDDAAESPFPRNIFLDVDVVAPGNVWLRNDVARVEAAGKIHLGGELARPEVIWRFALFPGGLVRYRDVEYRIEYGTLDQTDPKRINPYVDFRGRTRVAEYEISLHLEGTLDKFDYELTATPPLSSQDIISLLVTGKTLDSLSGSASSGALPGDMAAYYFAGLLSSAFGKQIQNSLGIDQLEVTPLLGKGGSDPTARVTVGKQVSDDVKISFSEDIGTAQKQTYQVSWDVSRRLRLITESDSDAGLGGELQYAKQFGGAPIVERPVTVLGLPGQPEDVPGPVTSIQVEMENGSQRDDLLKVTAIHEGDRFNRARMLQGGDRIRASLTGKGYIQAVVRPEAVLESGPTPSYRIVYRVGPGPAVVVQLVMSDGKGKRRAQKTLKEFVRTTPYTPDFWDEAASAMVDELEERGYYAADVTSQVSDGPSSRTVRIVVDRGQPVRLRAVRFVGVTSIPRERVDQQVSSMKGQGLRKRLLRPAVLARDLAAVRALYREEGFTRVRVGQPRIELSATGDSAEVEVAVEEGRRFTVGDLNFSAGDVATDEELRNWTPLVSGETFSPRRLAEAEQTLKGRFDKLGYPDVNVESEVALGTDEADVTFAVETGTRKTVGDIAIVGNRITKNRTIAKALTFGRGDLLSNQEMLESQQRLYRTGLFSSVKLTFAPLQGADDPAQTVTVTVEEAPPLSLGLGVGYDSDGGPRASFLIGYSNLGGRNVAIALQGLASGKENRALLTMRRRRVFGNTIDALASILYEKTKEDAYTETRRGLSFRFEQRPKPRWIRFLRYSIQDTSISDVTDAQAAIEAIYDNKLSSGRLGAVGLGLVRDTRDDAFLPTRGGYASIEGTVYAKPFASEFSFLKLFLRGSWTLSFKRGTRFASFMRIGAERPFSDTEVVPLSERFFAGGPNTLRGFATDSVGGLEVLGVNLGGESLFILNEEYHVPLWRSLRGVLFFDAGNVYATLDDFDPTHLRSSAGAGFRLDTPIGPIRIEYGWKLDREPGESTGELVFAIGTVF